MRRWFGVLWRWLGPHDCVEPSTLDRIKTAAARAADHGKGLRW